jgi:hypothetical protein
MPCDLKSLFFVLFYGLEKTNQRQTWERIAGR